MRLALNFRSGNIEKIDFDLRYNSNEYELENNGEIFWSVIISVFGRNSTIYYTISLSHIILYRVLYIAQSSLLLYPLHTVHSTVTTTTATTTTNSVSCISMSIYTQQQSGTLHPAERNHLCRSVCVQ